MKSMLVAVLLLLSVSSQAKAQDVIFVSESYREFGKGYFEQGEYEQALRSFKTAYAMAPLPEYIFDVALTYYKMDCPYASRDWLRMFFHSKLTQDEKQNAEKLANVLVLLIDEDFDANGFRFACSRMETSLQHCGIHQWSKDELATYQLWVRKQH